jgi:VWFA-related protein
VRTTSPGSDPASNVREVVGALLATFLLVVAPTGRARAQTPDSEGSQAPAPVFTEKVDVRVINVDVVVTDRQSRPVLGLDREDFELRVDGEPVEITNFYAETEEGQRSMVAAAAGPGTAESDPSFRPLEEVKEASRRPSYVVLLVDHTRLRSHNRKRTFAAIRQAMASLDEDDLVAVVGVEGRLVFYSDFLYDRRAIGRVLDDLTRVSVRTEVLENERRQIFGELARGQSGGILARSTLAEPESTLTRIQAYAASEFDRSLRSMRQIETVVRTLAGLPGRKTLFYVAEGIPTRPGEGLYVEWRNRFSGPERGLRHYDFNSDYERAVGRFDLTEPMRQLAGAANRAEVTLYAIDAAGAHGGEIRSVLTEQGATSEAVSVVDENYREPLEYASKATGGRLLQSSGTLADQLVELVDSLQTFYSLGFTPPADWEPGADHDVRVEVRASGLRVRHRERVVLPAPDEREAGATVAALMFQSVDNPLGLRAVAGDTVPREDGTTVLPIQLEIPIDGLSFLPKDGTQAGSLTIYVSRKDADGDPSQVQRIPFHLAIPDDKMDEARGNVAHYPLPIVLRKGDQQVAIGVRDNTGGVYSAVRLDVSGHRRP